MRQVTYIYFCLLISNTIFSQALNQACPYDNSVRDTLDFSTAFPGDRTMLGFGQVIMYGQLV